MAVRINQLLQACRELIQQPDKVVLATIIETMGSTYQKAGARMLIPENGEFTGLLGGGCFESDLKERAASVFRDGKPKLVFYDMRSPDDAVWGLGLGCNGAVRVFLQLLSAADHFHPLDVIAGVAETNRTGVLATVYESNAADFPVAKSVFLETLMCGEKYTVKTDYDFLRLPAQRILIQDRPQALTHDIHGHNVRIFYDIIKPPRQLLVLGAGPDAVPVTRLAKTMDWRVTVVDHRPAYIKPERFPGVDRLLNIKPEELTGKVRLDEFDALVMMTHSIEYDERYLKVIAASKIPFIGLLGPAKRRDRLLDSLDTAAEQIKGRVFGPVGLDIGAETPEEIALSIMAEIHAASTHRDGARLYQKNLPLHDRETPN